MQSSAKNPTSFTSGSVKKMRKNKEKKNKELELYADVIDDFDDMQEKEDVSEKESKKMGKRLDKSIGNIETWEKGTVYCGTNKKGKLVPQSDVLDPEMTYEVNLGTNGIFSTTEQGIAEILSYVVQINARLQRMEERQKKIEKILDEAKNG